MMVQQLNWNRCQPNDWCNLMTLNLDHPHFQGMQGVYVIWHGGSAPHTVRVGQGIIADRLRAHRDDPAILKYSYLGLFATWAAVGQSDRDGIEHYLAEALTPLAGDRFPAAPQLSVNLPW